ncbi:MAG: PAS domain S-box protein [Methylocystis sp.]
MVSSSVLSGSVPVREFLRAFPFYFVWDKHDRIVEIGPSLAKVCPNTQKGARLQEIFHSRRPSGDFSSERARNYPGGLILLENRANQCILRGSLMFLEESGLTAMLATPWITEPSQLTDHGLALNDFGEQDQTLDLLQVLQSQRMVVADLRLLNETLTEQRAKLREQEAQSRKLALVASRTDNAVIVTDAQGRVEWVNEGFTRITGWSLEDALGRKPGEFLQGPGTDPAVVQYMSAHIQAKRGFSAEVLNYRRDGREVWLAIEIQPLLDDLGEVANFMGIESDITDRKRNQEALEEYRQHLEALVENRTQALQRNKLLLEAIVKTTPNGLLLIDHVDRICMTNAALDQMFGYGVSELLGRPLEDLVPESKRDWYREERAAFARLPATRSMGADANLFGRRKDGSCFPIDVSLATFSVNEEQYVQATVADITARKRAEDALRDLNSNLERKVEERTAELAAASAAKSEFLANMSHEIRTPLNGILGLAQLLEIESLETSHREMVERIRQAGQSLLGIINDILDFSKIEAGQLRIDSRPFELEPMLAHIVSLLGGSARRKGLDFRVDVPPTFEGTLIGDVLRLEQVLMNLVGNAVKFTERGEIRLSVRAVSFTPLAARLRFEVQDTGIGIAPEQLAILFTPFTQADAAITRRFGGTGLGLSICKRLIALMGGDIGVETTIGAGSTFWFEAPFERARTRQILPETIPPRPESRGPRLSGLRCLVVDDSRMNRDVVERMLIKEGAGVTLAVDGQQALEFLRARGDAFDAVLMDVQMPVMDGLAATRVIRDELNLTTLPVIAFTAGVLTEQRQRVHSAGCDDFLPKPVDLDELVAVLTRWTARTRSTSPVDAEKSEEFPDIPGLDTCQAALSMGDDRNLFMDALRNFVEEFHRAARQTSEDLGNGNVETVAQRLHALRGAAGYIGAADLSKSALALESAILEKRLDLAAPMAEFETKFSGLIEEILKWRQSLSSPDSFRE